MRVCQFRLSMVARHGCSCRTFIFGKARNGYGECALWKGMNEVSGSRWAIIITVIPGKSRDMRAIETLALPVRRLEWQLAQVREIVVETIRVKSLCLQVTGWQGHRPGQDRKS